MVMAVRVCFIRGIEMGIMVTQRHAKACAYRRESLHGDGDRNRDGEEKAFQPVRHSLKLYYGWS